jgi:hypothetical protein
LISVLISFAFFFGCNTFGAREVRIKDNWGRSYETTAFKQIVNPDAGRYSEPIEYLDGQAAEHVYKKYQDGFSTPEEPSTVFNLNIAGGN